MKKVYMIVPSFSAKGGITTVVNGYKKIKSKEYQFKFLETYTDKNKLCKFLFFIKAFFTYIYNLIFWKPCIIHVHMAFGGSFYRKSILILFAKLFRKKIIIHIHGSYIDSFYNNANILKKRFIKYILLAAHKLIVLSDEWKTIFSKIVQTDNIVIVENYGEIHEDYYLNNSFQNNKIIVLFLGFISKLKGCYDIPQIINRVVSKNSDVKFIIAGSGEIEEVRAMIDNKFLKNVEFPGWIDSRKKAEYLKKTSIYLLPSYSEAMPMSILEAMGCGIPVVSTNVGGIPKLIENEKNGYLSNPGDISFFVESIEKLICDSELRKRIGKKNIETVKEKYSFEIHLKKILDVYKLV